MADAQGPIGEFFDEYARHTFSPHDMELVRRFRTLPKDDQSDVEEFIGFKRAKLVQRDEKDGTDER